MENVISEIICTFRENRKEHKASLEDIAAHLCPYWTALSTRKRTRPTLTSCASFIRHKLEHPGFYRVDLKNLSNSNQRSFKEDQRLFRLATYVDALDLRESIEPNLLRINETLQLPETQTPLYSNTRARLLKTAKRELNYLDENEIQEVLNYLSN